LQEQIDEFKEREMQTKTMYDKIITTINSQQDENVRPLLPNLLTILIE
jgi:hypothetical protein